MFPVVALRGLENFIADMQADHGVVINTARRMELLTLLTDKIIQLPVHYI